MKRAVFPSREGENCLSWLHVKEFLLVLDGRGSLGFCDFSRQTRKRAVFSSREEENLLFWLSRQEVSWFRLVTSS
jgi:hypothetical protein